jgi:hypothetical protein
MTDRDGDWFAGGSKLGIDFGIVEGASGAWRARRCVGDAGVAVGLDLAAMTALCEERTKDFIKLETQLEQSMTADNQPLTVHMGLIG